MSISPQCFLYLPYSNAFGNESQNKKEKGDRIFHPIVGEKFSRPSLIVTESTITICKIG